MVYATKMPMRMTASTRVTVRFSGSVSEYRHATVRYAISTEFERSSLTSPTATPCFRHRHQASTATIDQPTPISSRLAPVMLARASEHGDAVELFAAAHRLPNSATACPALSAKTKSTAYSGRTAMSARSAIANPAEMSSWAASAAHDRMKAAPTMARPKSSASAG